MNLFRFNIQYLERFCRVGSYMGVRVDSRTLVFVRGAGFTSTSMVIRRERDVFLGSVGRAMSINYPHHWRDDIPVA